MTSLGALAKIGAAVALGVVVTGDATRKAANGWAGEARVEQDSALAATPSAQRPQTISVMGYHVAPDGSRDGDGSTDQPWDLQTALDGGRGRVQPGDTVWLRGGRYVGDDFTTALNGTPEARITFRQHPGERATIDGRLLARGAYLDFWDFEITQSDPLSKEEQQLLDGRTNHGRYINLILHDANGQGVNFWVPGVDAEMYGNIIYNNGTHENLDHGVYVHNETGVKRIVDNVFFNNYARGIQIYASRRNPVLRNIVAEGNISFNNGTISERSTRVNLLINSGQPMDGLVASGNYLYFSPSVTNGINLRIGVIATEGNLGVTVEGNYAVGGRRGLEMPLPWTRATVRNNTIIGSRDLVLTGGTVATAYTWEHNTYITDSPSRAWTHDGKRSSFDDWRQMSGLGITDRVVSALPTAPKVVVRPNTYEPGRAHVAIYNWSRQATVLTDLSSVLSVGDRFEVHNVQDLFGPPVLSGTYDGNPVSFPMAGTTPPPPIGRTTPREAPRTGPDFDVFLVRSARL